MSCPFPNNPRVSIYLRASPHLVVEEFVKEQFDEHPVKPSAVDTVVLDCPKRVFTPLQELQNLAPRKADW